MILEKLWVLQRICNGSATFHNFQGYCDKMVVVNLPTKTLKEKLSLAEPFAKTLGETLFKIGMALESCTEEETVIDIAGAGNRIDAVSLEGISRIISAYHSGSEFTFPPLKKSKNVINIDKSVAYVRPFMGNFIVRDIKITGELLTRIINYQEKIASTFGRDRKVLGMGLFKLPALRFPLQYIALPAGEIKFAPLGFNEELTGEEILQSHEKGKAYAHLFAGKDTLPILRDAAGKILTMPGITNSNDLGRVEPGKQDLFVEATGTNLNMISRLLCANALDFAQLGGKVETCTANYSGKRVEFPKFSFENYSVLLKEINSLLGSELGSQEVKKLLNKMMLPSKIQKEKIQVMVPGFRSDVVHKVDVIEDIARAYGFDNFSPLPPSVYTFGKKHPKSVVFDAVVNSFVGAGFQQVIGMILTNKEEATQKVKQSDDGKFVELFSSRALGLNVCRRSLFPSLLGITANNKQFAYPQRIFEVGECLELDGKLETGAKTTWKTAALEASADASFTHAKALAQALGRSLDDYELKISPAEDSRFIKGRCAKVRGKTFTGVFGEVDLEILRNFGIEMPCSFLELELKQK
ncbi:phenylalanine--tRNA ligase subunit beta [Candidatus Micrarchaeota archaeon]|nr:phenylalanine--tRNA ligase subunit beta [Candidatus Micrarchaeota archaeon]